jgi:hypothetical protein
VVVFIWIVLLPGLLIPGHSGVSVGTTDFKIGLGSRIHLISDIRKINPSSRIYADMQLIRLDKVGLPCGDASNWYSRLEYCIGSRVDLGFMCRF